MIELSTWFDENVYNGNLEDDDADENSVYQDPEFDAEDIDIDFDY